MTIQRTAHPIPDVTVKPVGLPVRCASPGDSPPTLTGSAGLGAVVPPPGVATCVRSVVPAPDPFFLDELRGPSPDTSYW